MLRDICRRRQKADSLMVSQMLYCTRMNVADQERLCCVLRAAHDWRLTQPALKDALGPH
jgi:hypothetical protein